MSAEKTVDPLLIDVPDRIATDRLLLRCPRPGDGALVNAAICGSLERLKPWMSWAQTAPAVQDSELWCRRAHARFAAREDLIYLCFERDALVGCIDLHRIAWNVPRFEVGYWCRSTCEGRGLVTEAVKALARMAFDALGARRVEIRVDARNLRSARVAERAGFVFEGLLRQDEIDVAGAGRDTRLYSRVRGVEEV